jgi:hypothetical protein
MELRDRCKEFYQSAQRRAITRTGSPVDDLMGFVLSEIGRCADDKLTDTKALVIYFDDDAGRDEFLAAVCAAKPGMMTKRMP